MKDITKITKLLDNKHFLIYYDKNDLEETKRINLYKAIIQESVLLFINYIEYSYNIKIKPIHINELFSIYEIEDIDNQLIFTTLKKKFCRNQNIEQEFYKFFGNENRNIFSYSSQIVCKNNKTHHKLSYIDDDQEKKLKRFHHTVREIVANLACIPKDVLLLNDIYEFEDKIEEVYEESHHIKKPLLLNYISTKESETIIPKFFEDYKLMYDLERNNFDEYTLGEEDFEYYFELPNYFYNGKVENRTLIDRIKSTEIFLMKGLTGTGKTSICKKLAYMFSKEHSLYIDFSNIENRVLTNKVKNDLENLSQYLAKFKGRLILDNIESTKYSKQFSEYCCQLTLEYDIFIILITSNMKYELDKEYNHNLLCYDNTSVAQDFVTMNIENYLNTLIKKKLLDKNGTEHLIANKLYHTFKSSLSLLNAAFRHKHSINELSINDADEYIISSYHKLCTTPYDKKFLSYIFFFLKIEGILIIQKDILLKSFLQEFQILEKLVDIGFLKKDFEVDPVEVYIFTFEHKVMADIIFEHFYKENLNDTTIFLEDIKYLLESFYLMMPIMIRYHIGNNKHEVFMEKLSNKLKESVSKKINTRTKLIISVVVDYLFIFDMLTKGNQLNVLHEQVNNKVELSDSSLIDVSSLFQETSRIHIYNNYFTYYSKIIDWKYNNISECINDLENETLQI